MSIPYDILCDKVRGCLIGVKIGDVLGMPWELMTREEIDQATNGKGVRGLQDLPPGHTRKISDTRGLVLGESTDDWQLTLSVGQSIVRRRGFDVTDQALAHVDAYETSTKGWGRSTRLAMEEFKLYFDSRGVQGRSPLDPIPSEEKRGLGNGIMMKLSPLACWAGLMGHGDDLHLRKWIVALTRFSHTETVSPVVGHLILSGFEKWSRSWPMTDDERAVWETVTDLHSGRPATLEKTYLTCGTSFSAHETARFVTALTVPYGLDMTFVDTLLAAINGGGDTDTNASICGGIMGAKVGREVLLREVAARLPGITRDIWGEADELALSMISTAEDVLASAYLET